jgi:hypothetical protein
MKFRENKGILDAIRAERDKERSDGNGYIRVGRFEISSNLY